MITTYNLLWYDVADKSVSYFMAGWETAVLYEKENDIFYTGNTIDFDSSWFSDNLEFPITFFD